MKKSLIFGISLVLIVLMASGVFAGWFGLTGNALKTGERITEDSSLIVKGIEDNKVRIGNDIYSEGQTFTDSGKTYEVKAIEKKAWFFGSDKVVIEEVEPVEENICWKMLSGNPSNKEMEECEKVGGEIYCGNGWCKCACENEPEPDEPEPIINPVTFYTLKVGEEMKYEEYTISLLGIKGEEAVFKVNLETNSILEESKKEIGGLILYVFDVDFNSVDFKIEEIKPEVTYEGVLNMLGSCKIMTNNYRENYARADVEINTCNEICKSMININTGKRPLCIAAARARFENLTYIPDYFEPVECNEEQSPDEFRMYCTCCYVQLEL